MGDEKKVYTSAYGWHTKRSTILAAMIRYAKYVFRTYNSLGRERGGGGGRKKGQKGHKGLRDSVCHSNNFSTMMNNDHDCNGGGNGGYDGNHFTTIDRFSPVMFICLHYLLTINGA
ncbi:hypothetical protein K449DRAFT_45996 [Hypoxylon sp. EC38]|nr:hypothetical protein K449DRAFT_45996 [Hypoxylon sp. EC38]